MRSPGMNGLVQYHQPQKPTSIQRKTNHKACRCQLVERTEGDAKPECQG